MDGMLLKTGGSDSANANLAALVTRLLAEVDQLRAEVAGLRRENLELRQQAGYWQSRHADAVQRIAALEQENELLRGENRKLQAECFGRRSEKHSGSDRSNDLEDPADRKAKRKRGRQPDQPAPQRRDYSHLTDPQVASGCFGVGRNPARQVRQSSANTPAAGTMALFGVGLGRGHRERWSATLGALVPAGPESIAATQSSSAL